MHEAFLIAKKKRSPPSAMGTTRSLNRDQLNMHSSGLVQMQERFFQLDNYFVTLLPYSRFGT